MPSKKKKYNARFPPARIKKIMQSDEEVGKVAQAVPVIISRALELFVENLLKKAETVTHGRNAKTLTPSHLKQCIMAEQRFDFLKDVVASIPDVQGDEDAETPRSAVSNTAFVFPTSTATSSSSTSSSSAPQTPTSAPPHQPEPTTPSYASSLPDQKPPTYPGGMHQLPMTLPQSQYPPRSLQSTMNPSVPVIVPNPSVIHQPQQHSQSSHMMNPVGGNSSPYIPTSAPDGHYAMYQQQQHNPNGLGMSYGGNESMLSYGVQRADGSHPNPQMHGGMYDHKNSAYQYHHHPQHQNQYHSQ